LPPAGVAAATKAASDDDLKAALKGLKPEEREKLAAALGGKAASEDPPAAAKEKKEKKKLDEFTQSELANVMKMFAHTDRDSNGYLDSSEFKDACQNIFLMDEDEIDISEADSIAKDGKIDPMEFLVWYTGCEMAKAEKAFKDYSFFFAKQNKQIKQWSHQEVVSVLSIFKQFCDKSEFMDSKALASLCEIMGIDATVAEGDLNKDGKIGKKEFFAFYVGCTPDEAAVCFADHAYLFAPEKQLKDWSVDEVTSVLKIFKEFDADNSGFIDEKELANLCDILCIDATVTEADNIIKDGKLGEREFFGFYVGCDKEEADKVFEDHADLFKN